MGNFPEKYIQRMREMLPECEWDDFFAKVTKPLPKTIRVKKDYPNKIPATWSLQPVAHIPNTYFIQRENQAEEPLGKTLEHFTGGIYVASLSSLLSPLILEPTADDYVLDMCSAPGSKATFIAEMMQNQGLLVVNEPSGSRSKKLVSNIERMGVLNSVLLQSDGTKMSYFFDQRFSKILLDAPCSSEGFARKDSKYFDKMWSEKKIFEAAKLQKKLIVSAFEMLMEGGEMVYSTCTSAPEENEAVVQHLLDRYPDSVEIVPIQTSIFKLQSSKNVNQKSKSKDQKEKLQIANCKLKFDAIPFRSGITKFFNETYDSEIAENVIRIWPHLETDTWSSESFFIAKIRKVQNTPSARRASPPKLGGENKDRLKILSKNQSAEITSYLKKNWGWGKDLWKGYAFIQKNNAIWITSKEAARFALKNPHRRVGFPVLDEYRNITSVFAIQFGVSAKTNFVTLDTSQKEKWLRGEDLYFDEPLNPKEGSEVLVRYEHFCLGYGKVQNEGTKLKNKLDRDLVI